MLTHNYTIIKFFLPVLDCSEFRRGLGLLGESYKNYSCYENGDVR